MSYIVNLIITNVGYPDSILHFCSCSCHVHRQFWIHRSGSPILVFNNLLTLALALNSSSIINRSSPEYHTEAMVSLHNPNSNSNSNSIDLPSADRPFDNIINFRDVGRTINAYLGGQYVLFMFQFDGHGNGAVLMTVTHRMLKEGVLFRSARVCAVHPSKPPG